MEKIEENVIRKKVKSFREIESVLKKVKKFEILDVAVSYPSLEEIFIKLYKGVKK